MGLLEEEADSPKRTRYVVPLLAILAIERRPTLQASGIVVQTQRSMHIDLEPTNGVGRTYEMELDSLDEKDKSAHSHA